MHNHDTVSADIWHKSVPLKVSICVWRLLRNRWPTKDNLARRGIIADVSQLCMVGCGFNESTYHLLLCCSIFGTLWQLVKDWIGVSFANPYNINDNFTQFAYYTGGSKRRRSFLQLIWLCCVSVLCT